MDRHDAAGMEGRTGFLREDLIFGLLDLDLSKGPAHPTPDDGLGARGEGLLDVAVAPELQHAHGGAIGDVDLGEGPTGAQLRRVDPNHPDPEGTKLPVGRVVQLAKAAAVLVPPRDVVQEVFDRL